MEIELWLLFFMEDKYMYLNICKVDNKVIDFKISESKKENSDFNKSLVTAGFSFWKDCNIDIWHVNNMQDAKKILLSYPLNKKRVFESIEESMEETKIICYCPDCGHITKSADNYCSICGFKFR